MNELLKGLKNNANYKRTENGAVALSSTTSKLYDLFALGGAYRSRSEEDCILLFKEAYIENPVYAIKCLTYIRDILEGQGERRFFRICLKWLAAYDVQAAIRNMQTWVKDGYIRWDDLFVLFDTPAEEAMINLVSNQLVSDVKILKDIKAAPSLCAKWMPSCNCSSAKTKSMGRKFVHALQLNERSYRKMLSALRERINIVERLMSQNRWEEIDFSKLPSRAGLIYRNAFAKHDIIAEKYREFIKSDKTTVNTKALYPYDIVREAQKVMGCEDYWSYRHCSTPIDETQRLVVNKYWDNLHNIFDNATLNAMVVCDTSFSMLHGASNTASPMSVAVSLALYAAEKAKGPFSNHYISYSHIAKLVETRGVDFCDKVKRIVTSNVCENTNLESVFDLLLSTALQNHVSTIDMPRALIVISDMEIDESSGFANSHETFIASMRKKWDITCHGKYEFPDLYLWNVSARNDTFLTEPRTGITFLSGCSPILFEQILQGLTGEQLMMKKLNSKRYEKIS